MSSYRHDPKKFADAGLQLRLPVDLVPAMQYSKLTNVLPVIEGELRTREGVTFIADLFKTVYVALVGRADLVSSDIIRIYNPLGTDANAGFVVGQQVIVTILTSNVLGNIFPVGSFTTTITGIATPAGFMTGYTISPAIPGTVWDPLPADIALIYAQAIGQDQITTLPNTVVTNIFRLTQSVAGFTGDRLAVMAGRVFHAPLPDGNVFYELGHNGAAGPPVLPLGLSGRTVSIIGFRFTDDTASWAIIADANGMLRYRENPGGPGDGTYFFTLGKPAPPTAASAVDGGAGVLDSTGGTGYDWRYTFHDDIVNTEGNPSPITTGPPDVERPNAFTNPATGVPNAQPVGSPGNAIDGSGTSFTTAVGSIFLTIGSTPPFDDTTTIVTQACIYRNVTNPASPPSEDVFLNIVYDTAISGGLGVAQALIEYSTDAGTTYKSVVNTVGSIVQTTAVVKLDTTVDYTNLRIRIRATGLSAVPNSEAVVMTLHVYDINITTAATTGALALVNKQATVTIVQPADNDGRITGFRLYRRGGSLPDAWRLVGTFALAGFTGTVTDNVSDTTLSVKPIMDLDNDAPVTSVSAENIPLTFIWGPVGLEARVLGCGDPNRPECVYFSKPGNADAWPPQNFIEVCEPGTPVVAGCVFNTRTYAFSREAVYEMVEGLGTGTTFSPFKTPSAHGLYSPWAFSANGPAIFFMAKDGIYMTTGGQDESIVENDLKPLFATYDGPGQDVEGYEAVDMSQPDNIRLCYHNSELYFLYMGLTTGTRKMMIYDLLKKRWRAAQYTNGMSDAYSEPNTVSSLLFGTAGGSIYQAGGDFDPVTLDTLENVIVASTPTFSDPVTIPAGTYFAYVSRLTSAGEVALSHEVGNILVSVFPPLTHAIGVHLPENVPADTTGWRVYFGLVSGQEAQYQEFPAFTSPNNFVRVSSPGTAGTLPIFGADSLIHCVLRTGAHDQGAPLNQKQYGNVIFDLDPGGADATHPVTITPLINGETQTNAALTVIGSGRQQVPLDLSDYFAFNTEYEIAWSRAAVAGGISDPRLFQYDTLHFIEPVSVRHWEAQPTAFGFPGFMHCRDGYIAIRSTADVTLTMTFDTGEGEVTQTYTLPSTNGQREKVYVQFASNKGLSYRFALDSAQDFRVYGEDLEIRVKPWLGLLGYAVQRPLGGEVNA